jgi:TM2 domain-containing membrane protein YozV
MMEEQLPGIGGARPRIKITEGDLTPSRDVSRPTRPPEPPEAKPAAMPALAPTAQQKLTPGESYCSGCGRPIHSHAVVCPRCGVATTNAVQATGAAMNIALNSKSTGLAILLSLVFTGAGHWYVGRVGRGCAFFAAAFFSALLTLVVIGLFLLPIVWVWAAVDANKCAQMHNRILLAQSGAQLPPI